MGRCSGWTPEWTPDAKTPGRVTWRSCIAEAEGLEPPRACARRISSAVPYQLGLRLRVPIRGADTTVKSNGLRSGDQGSRRCRAGDLRVFRRPAERESERNEPGGRVACRARFCKLRRACCDPPTPVGETGFEPATPASRTQCSTGLSYSPKLLAPKGLPPDGRRVNGQRTGWDSNPRGLFTPHDFQSCSLSRSDTRPASAPPGR